MADVFRAYQFLNKSLNLKLSDEQMARAEAAFRLDFIKEREYGIAKEEIGNWEFFSYLAPRKDYSRPELAPKPTKSKKG